MAQQKKAKKRVSKRPSYAPKQSPYDDRYFDYYPKGIRSHSWNDLIDYMRHYGLKTQRDVSEFLCVSIRTLQRWNLEDKAPRWAWRCMLLKSGRLGAVFPQWKHWCIDGETINFNKGEIVKVKSSLRK